MKHSWTPRDKRGLQLTRATVTASINKHSSFPLTNSARYNVSYSMSYKQIYIITMKIRAVYSSNEEIEEIYGGLFWVFYSFLLRAIYYSSRLLLSPGLVAPCSEMFITQIFKQHRSVNNPYQSHFQG